MLNLFYGGLVYDTNNVEELNSLVEHPICKLIKANKQTIQYKLST